MDQSQNCNSDKNCKEISEKVTDSDSSKILKNNNCTFTETSSIQSDQTLTSSDLMASTSTSRLLTRQESEIDIFADSNRSSFIEKLKKVGRYFGNRFRQWKDQGSSSNQVSTLDPSKHSTSTEILVLDYASDITGFYKIKMESSDNTEVGIEATEEYNGKYELPAVPIMVHKDFKNKRIEIKEEQVKPITSFNANFNKWNISRIFSNKLGKESGIVNSDVLSANPIDVNWRNKSSAPINIPNIKHYKREKLNQERFRRFRPMEEDSLHFDLRVKPEFRRQQVQNMYGANRGRNCEYIFVSETGSKVIKVDKEKIALLANKCKSFNNSDNYNNILSRSEEKEAKHLLSFNSEENLIDSQDTRSSKLLILNAAKLLKSKELFRYFRLKSMVRNNRIFKKKKICLRLSRKSKLPAIFKSDLYSLFSDNVSFASKRKNVFRRASTVRWYSEASVNKRSAKYSRRFSLSDVYDVNSQQDAFYTLEFNITRKDILKIEEKNQAMDVISGNPLQVLSPTNMRTLKKSSSYPGSLESTILVDSCNPEQNILTYKSNLEAPTLVNKCLIDSTVDILSTTLLEKVDQKKIDWWLESSPVNGETKRVSDDRKEKAQNPPMVLSVEEREAGSRSVTEDIVENKCQIMKCPTPRMDQLVKEDNNKEKQSE